VHTKKIITELEFYNSEVISLGEEHLNACVELDLLALKGLWTKKQWSLELTNNRRISIGVVRDSILLAMASGWIITNELHITAVAVHPLHRRKGLGRLILLSLLDKARMSGTKNTTLEVKRNNEAAIEMYKSLGFRVGGQRPNFYKDGSDALILWLD